MTEQQPEKSKKSTIFGGLGILGVAAFKFKAAIFGLLKGLTLFKFGWFLKSGISLIVTVWFYTAFFGFPFALAVIILLMTHEMGHYIWMKATGLDPKLPIFVPGVGAYVAMTKLPPDQTTRAWVAFAGPLIGSLASAAMYWAGVHAENGWLMAAGSTGFFLNLLQLVPAKPLDGGFVIGAVSEWLLIPGTIALFVISFLFHSILLFIIAVISLFSLIGIFRRRFQGAQPADPTMVPASLPQRIAISIAYLSLAGMLAYLYYLSHSEVISMIHHKSPDSGVHVTEQL